ncbi:L-threonylcarbamoyladenylate synthase [Candidatus Poseidoniaceae archaeon]|nr:L-threonylcarbamoyladenylate synthase [Euryarchaeota archaeon]MDA8843400.1 L-threonylcarbamoyladenylate synthase [Euryarchaeota archaeon]MDA9166966.1 L-threonylcarbamoyladenylate synthase [Candidatus Poseidoniaceae archaeon]MDC3236923.1 L-threonylcarbamoyladenylate synthase [Candidatus Poseidoniaceae archaeon]
MGEIPIPIIDILRANGVVAYPTSTLPGLATLPTSEALDRLFALKQRRSDQPVSLGVASLEQAELLVEVPAFAYRLLEGFDRGALTLILDAHAPLDARLGGSRVAVRVFAHPTAIALAETVGPVTATSANEAGIAPLDEAYAAGRELGLQSSAILPGKCPGGNGSTLVSVVKSPEKPSGFSVSIMREGVIPTNDVDAWMSKNH